MYVDTVKERIIERACKEENTVRESLVREELEKLANLSPGKNEQDGDQYLPVANVPYSGDANAVDRHKHDHKALQHIVLILFDEG